MLKQLLSSRTAATKHDSQNALKRHIKGTNAHKQLQRKIKYLNNDTMKRAPIAAQLITQIAKIPSKRKAHIAQRTCQNRNNETNKKSTKTLNTDKQRH